MKLPIVIVIAAICVLSTFISLAQQAPGPSSTKPVVPAPQGKTISPTAPPTALLKSPNSIKVAPGVVITITSTNDFSIGQARQWLRQASMNPLK